MKARFLMALAGLAIGFNLPLLVQEQTTVDSEVHQRLFDA